MVMQKIIAARDLIKFHPLTPELATEMFTRKGMGVFYFSAALIGWSESELNDVNDCESKPTKTLGTCHDQQQVLSNLPKNTRRQGKRTAHINTDTGVVAACREIHAT